MLSRRKRNFHATSSNTDLCLVEEHKITWKIFIEQYICDAIHSMVKDYCHGRKHPCLTCSNNGFNSGKPNEYCWWHHHVGDKNHRHTIGDIRLVTSLVGGDSMGIQLHFRPKIHARACLFDSFMLTFFLEQLYTSYKCRPNPVIRQTPTEICSKGNYKKTLILRIYNHSIII